MEPITNVHDKFFRETFSRREIAYSFLDAYLPPSIGRQIDLETLDIVKDSFVDPELRDHYSTLFTRRNSGRRKSGCICSLSIKAIRIGGSVFNCSGTLSG